MSALHNIVWTYFSVNRNHSKRNTFEKYFDLRGLTGCWTLGAGSNEYSRVLDYSIFKSLLVPYSENFTTRPSSRVVAIFTFFVRIIQISKKWKSNTSMMTSCNNPNNVHLPLSWNSCTKRGIKIQNTPKLGIWGGLASQFSWPLEAC